MRALAVPAFTPHVRLFLLFSALGILSACVGEFPRLIDYPPETSADYPIGIAYRGTASWYGPGFHGRRTANGEVYDMHKLTAAHRTLPLGSVVQVRSLSNGRQVTVRINDRGPFVRGRILDLSYAGAKALGMTGNGTDEVELRVLGFQGQPGVMGVLRVQVASFGELANATALKERLEKEYLAPAKLVMVDLPEGRRYRVQIGQYQSERQAQLAADRIARDLDLDPFVVRDDGESL
jgi:rare lipoprotein A